MKASIDDFIRREDYFALTGTSEETGAWDDLEIHFLSEWNSVFRGSRMPSDPPADSDAPDDFDDFAIWYGEKKITRLLTDAAVLKFTHEALNDLKLRRNSIKR